ncbi:hypothetical protein [Aestuariivirga sp.]
MARALRAVKQAGVDMVVEVTADGVLRVVPNTPDQAPKKRPVDVRKEIRM